MKFKVKNEFIYDSIRRYPGGVVDIKAEHIEILKPKNVLGDPVRSEKKEKAVKEEKEKAVRSKRKKST